MKKVDDRELKPKEPYWLTSAAFLLVTIYFISFKINVIYHEYHVNPVLLFTVIFFYIGMTLNLALRTAFFTASPKWRIRAETAVTMNVPRPNRFYYLIDGIKPFYISIILELSIVSFLLLINLVFIPKGITIIVEFALILFSAYIGQLIFLSAVTMISIWITFFSVRYKLPKGNTLGTIFLHLFTQFFWTVLILSVYGLISDKYLLSSCYYSDELHMALQLQLSALYFQFVFYYYYKKLRNSLNELESDDASHI